MPVIRHLNELAQQRGPGWTRLDWAGAAVFGEPVPMEAHRYRIEAGAAGPDITLGAQEAFAYVIAGMGRGLAGGESYPLAPEGVLWLAGCDGLGLEAGPDGLDVLVAESTLPAGGRAAATAPLRKAFAASELPHLVSTRDTRDRLDLVTDDVPVGARAIRADRIIYHPGDTAAAHYHADCHHVFCVLAGSGLLYSGEQALRLEAGMSALVGPGEEHWFEDDKEQDFSFVEFWAPPPADTVWTVQGDRCTWAPSSQPASNQVRGG
jgi:mannose-6-phosphate isomerase-like protein (cupin superfamily)